MADKVIVHNAAGWMELLHRNIILVLGVTTILIYMFTYLSNCFGPPIRADGEGYYAYLPAYLLHRDPSFVTLCNQRFEEPFANWTGLRRCENTGRYQNKFNAGVAAMMLPFFLFAHVLTWGMNPLPGSGAWLKFNYALDGYSLIYQHAAGLSGVFYAIMGMMLLKKALDRCFSPGVVIATLSTMVLGTNLLHYSSGETVLSHPYSFFLASCFVYLLPSLYERALTWQRAVLWGLLLGLAFWVRLTNVVVLVPVVLYGIVRWMDIPQRVRWGFSNLRYVGLMCGAVVAVLIPQLLINRYAVGKWFINAYAQQGYGFNFGSPALAGVLSSPKAGLLFWSPGLILCVPGFFLLRGEAKAYRAGLWGYTIAQVYLVASWFMWWFGGGFGHRAFVESYPWWALAMGSTFDAVKSRSARMLLGFVAVVSVAYSLFMMKLYYTRELSYYGLDYQALYDIMWSRKEYWANALRLFFASRL